MKKFFISTAIALSAIFVSQSVYARLPDCESFGGTYLVCDVEEEFEIINAVLEACDGGGPSTPIYIIYPESCDLPVLP
jgi:hypothetical protein